jgi:hypothetical protein
MFLGVRWDWVHLVRLPLIGILYQPRMIDNECGVVGGWELADETEVLGENLPNATLSTTNPTRPNLGSNPGLRGGKLAANRLSYGTAKTEHTSWVVSNSADLFFDSQHRDRLSWHGVVWLSSVWIYNVSISVRAWSTPCSVCQLKVVAHFSKEQKWSEGLPSSHFARFQICM